MTNADHEHEENEPSSGRSRSAESSRAAAGEPRWVLVSDVDDTLLGDAGALERLCEALNEASAVTLVLNSSRPLASVEATLATLPEALPARGAIGAMGTELRLDGSLCDRWADAFRSWDRGPVDRVLGELGHAPHADEFQTPLKASFVVPADALGRVRAALRDAGIACRLVHSGADDLDVLPPGAGKGVAVARVATLLGVELDQVIVAGDSANDTEMFEIAARGIVVGNARDELRKRVDPARVVFATQPRAAGVLEGLVHWGALAACSSPTRTESICATRGTS